MKNKTNISILLALIITSLGLLYLFKFQSNDNSAPSPQSSAPVEKLDLSPASAEDRARVDANKENIVKQDEQNSQIPSDGSTKKAVTPIIVDASQYGSEIEVRSFVPGTVESDGSCTITFTNGSNVLTKTVFVTPDASSTQCSKLKFPRSELGSSGSVSVTVSYSSTKSAGSSQPKIMEIK